MDLDPDLAHFFSCLQDDSNKICFCLFLLAYRSYCRYPTFTSVSKITSYSRNPSISSISFVAGWIRIRTNNYKSGSRSWKHHSRICYRSKCRYPVLYHTVYMEVTRTLGMQKTYQFRGWMFEKGKGGVELCNELGFRFLRQLEDILKKFKIQ